LKVGSSTGGAMFQMLDRLAGDSVGNGPGVKFSFENEYLKGRR